MVKVISGIYRNRILNTPKTKSTVPTKGNSKEGIFSSLNFYLKDSVVCDLFAGSGAYGIESLSRGAKYCYFNDNNNLALQALNSNINNLKITNAKVTKFDYLKCLKYYKENDITLDIVFIDPPYIMDIYVETVDFLINENILSHDGIIILEANHEIDLKKYEDLFTYKMYKYGYPIVYILRRK